MAENPNEKSAEIELKQDEFEKEYMFDMASVFKTKGRHAIHCLTIAGQVEGHVIAPQNQKTTKYEHVIPQIVAIEEDPEVDALLVILNTVGGDVEAGLAISELISGITKPSATIVLGGGHSIGIPLAVSAQRSFIVPTATMTIHPVRHSGLVLGVPQTMRYFEQMQQRITSYVTKHSNISAARFTQLMMKTGELVMDVGSVLDGRAAVKEGLIDSIGSVGDALKYLYTCIEQKNKKEKSKTAIKKQSTNKTAQKNGNAKTQNSKVAVKSTAKTSKGKNAAKKQKTNAAPKKQQPKKAQPIRRTRPKTAPQKHTQAPAASTQQK